MNGGRLPNPGLAAICARCGEPREALAWGGRQEVGAMTEIAVWSAGYWVPASIIGTDEHGRTLIICPHCSDHAYIDEDGRVVCPLGEATNRLFGAVLADLEPTSEAPPAFRRPE